MHIACRFRKQSRDYARNAVLMHAESTPRRLPWNNNYSAANDQIQLYRQQSAESSSEEMQHKFGVVREGREA